MGKIYLLIIHRVFTQSKCNRILLITLTLLLSLASFNKGFAQSNIYESYAIIDINNSGNTYYDLQANTGNTDFNGDNLGTFYPGNSLILNGAQNKVYKCGTDDIKDGWFYYRIYKTSDTPPSFSSGQTIFWKSNDGPSGRCSPNEVDQTWESSGAGINVLSSLTPGTYYLEMYTTANFTYINSSDNIVNDTHYANDGGKNYKATFTVAANPTVTLDSKTDVGCYGASTGTINISVSGGVAPYTYEWTKDGNSFSTSEDLTGLAAGSYSVTVKDANNQASDPLQVTISQAAAISVSSATVTSPILCNGGTGTVTIIATGGTAPLSYTFNGVTNATGIFTGVSAGNNLSYSVTDANSCTAVTGNINVTQPTAISVSSAAVSSPILCNGGTGTVKITATGGTAPLSYTFNGVTNATGIFTGVSAGNNLGYSVTDANSCTAVTGTLNVTQPAAISVSSATVTSPILCNGGTGTVTITATGGTTPLSYTFNGVTNATGIFTGVSAGNNLGYSVTDANSCTAVTGNINVTQPTAISVSSAAVSSPILCNGGTGTVKITATGGTAPLSYTFNGVTNATGTFTGVSAGNNLSYSVTDANSCTAVTGNINVTQPTAISVSSAAVSSPILCNGGTGTVKITATGGTAPLSYTFNGVTNATGTFTGVSAGNNLSYSVTDANSCTAVTGNINVTQPTAISVSSAAVSSPILCNGGTGTVKITATGGTAPLSYTFNGVTNATGTFTGVSAGNNLSYSVTDAKNCTAVTGNLNVTQPAGIIINSTSSNSPICAGSTLSLNASASGGTGTLTYSWTGPNSFAATGQNPSISNASVAASGNYKLTVTDANNCSSSAQTSVIVDAIPAAYAGVSQTVLRGKPIQLGANAVSGNTYSWTSTPSSVFSPSSDVSNPWVSPTVNTTYTLKETTPNASCSTTNSVTLTVKDSLSILKTITKTPTNPGDPITYQIDYKNLNPNAAATDVVITDLLPAQNLFTYSSSSDGGVFDNGDRTVTWPTIPSLAPNTGGTFTVTGIAGSTGANFGYDSSSYYMGKNNDTYTISNNASISNPNAGTVYINSPVTTTVQQYCGSTLDPDSTTGIINVNSFNEIYYLFTLTNTGNITDSFTLGIDTTFYPDAAGNSTKFNLGIWNITSISGNTITGTPWLQPGQKFSFLVYIKSDKGYQTGDSSLTDIISTSYVGGCVKKATTTTIIGDASKNEYKPDLMISKIASTPKIAVGSQFNYTLTINNVATNFPAEKGFIVKDTIVPGLKYISYSSSSSVTVDTETKPGPFGDTTIITATKSTSQINGTPEVITITVEPNCYAVPFVINKAYVNMISYTKKVTGQNIQVVDVNNLNDTSSTGVTVIPNINAPTALWQSVCFNSAATLTASGAGSGYDYKWYDAPTGGNLLQTNGYSYTISSLLKPVDSVYAEIYNTSNPVCASTRTKVRVTARNYWLGKTSTNWNTGSNWSDGNVAPSSISCPDVYIPLQTYQPILSSNTVTIRDIHLMNSGAMATVDGTGILQISRDILNSGNGLNVINTGAVEFNGGSAQNISSSMFTDTTISNMIVSNSNGVKVSGTGKSIAITGKLSVGTSGVINTGDNVTLKSSINGTASLGTVKSASQVNGQFTVERYINIGDSTDQHKKAWLFLAPPTKGQSVKDSWMEGGNNASTGYGVNIPNTVGTGWDPGTVYAPSIKRYDYLTDTWVSKNNSGGDMNATDSLYNPNGWMIFVRGDRSVTAFGQAPNNTNLRSKGTLPTGEQKFTIPVKTGIQGFYSLGNPYASAVDMTKVIDQSMKTPPASYYIWDPNLQQIEANSVYGLGGYRTLTYDGTNYTAVPNDPIAPFSDPNILRSGQAFFVQTDAVNPYIIVFEESSKADMSASGKENFRTAGMRGGKTSKLVSTLYNTSDQVIDGTLQIFDIKYSNSIDRQDARKLTNGGINLSLKVENKQLVVERRQPVSGADTIFFNLTGTSNGSYYFKFNATNILTPGSDAWLVDAYTKQHTPVSVDGETKIPFDVNNDAASKAVNRFSIVFRAAAALPVTFVKVEAVNEGPQVNVKWKVANEINLSKYVVMKSTDGNNFTDLTDVPANGGTDYFAPDKNPVSGYNYYRIRSVDRDGAQAYSEIAKVWMGNNKQSLSVFPNPVVNGMVNLRFENMPSGKYLIRLLNPSGQVILNNSLSFAGGNYNEKIPWNYQMAHGSYQLEITQPDGSVKTIIVMY